MKIKTSELSGAALDWAVAKCEGRSEPEVVNNFAVAWYTWGNTHYSTNWAQGGPIIERLIVQKGLVLRCWVERGRCEASLDSPHRFSHGPTPLIAAMRCYVASELGDEVEIPDELIGE